MGHRTKHALQPQQSAREAGNRALHARHLFPADFQYDYTRKAKSMITLDGIAAKLARAEYGINNLSKDLRSFCNEQQRFTTTVERPDLGETHLIFQGPNPVLSLGYSIYLGEIAYNLRSALDHLMWQLVLANYKLPTRSNEFPIFRDNSAYKRDSPRKLAGVSKDSTAAIGLMQPFLKDPRWFPLETLQEFCNIDKHRTLHLLRLRWDVLVYSDKQQMVNMELHIPKNREVEVETGDVLCSVPQDLAVTLTPLFDVRLTGLHIDGVVSRRQVDDEPHAARVLRRMLNTVREVVDLLKDELLTSPFLGLPQKFGIAAIDIPDTKENLSFNDAPKFIRDLLALRFVNEEGSSAEPIDEKERHWVSLVSDADANTAHIHLRGRYPASFNGVIHRTTERVSVSRHEVPDYKKSRGR